MKTLLKALRRLQKGAPECVAAEEGGGHWTATKDAIQAFLGRPLTPEEVTALSLSRGFGPCPAMMPDAVQRLYRRLFPEGNGCGAWYSWEELERELQLFQLEERGLALKGEVWALKITPADELVGFHGFAMDGETAVSIDNQWVSGETRLLSLSPGVSVTAVRRYYGICLASEEIPKLVQAGIRALAEAAV